MTWKTEWTKWNNHSKLPNDLQKQMTNMTEHEREDAFYKQLEFGTGGMRGELGTGSNRMNIYTIRKVTAGLARYIEENGTEVKKRGVVIAYDSRHGSAVEKIEDYQSGRRTNLLTSQQETMDLPSSNVLKYWLQDGSWFAIRPSGTEPKMKFYFGVKQVTENRSEKRLQEIQANVMSEVENTIYT